MSEPVTERFQAEVGEVLKLVVGSLYSHKEIFLRELVSNASDALDKLRFRALSEPELLAEGEQLRIRLSADADAGTLTIEDNGVGMTRDELAKNLGTIAWSGSREFAEKLAQAKQSSGDGFGLIGQFGVGFYSAYLVADEVEVESRAPGGDLAFTWRSEGKENFQIEDSQRAERGTSVKLRLKPDQREFLSEHRLRSLVERYSDYLNYPIELAIEKDVEEGGVKRKVREFQTINRASALWQRPAKEIEPEQYQEFYKHLTHDWEPPLAFRHFRIEGTQMFVGLLFIPKRKPMDLFDADGKHGVRLHVRRVLIMDNCEELLPRWLRFVRGLVDSEDLPLNVSRELLQDSRAVKIIHKQVISQMLELLEELARDKPEDYQTFWTNFGSVLKEGVHYETDLKQRIAALLRFESSAEAGLTTLDAYVNRMPQGQPAIYYATGTARRVLESSPHLEALKQRGYEVLFMTEPVDPFVIEGLAEYRNKPLISASNADLKLEPSDPEKPPISSDASEMIARFKVVLGERVSEVRPSTRLRESPACLVNQEGALPAHLERILRARNMDVPASKRILEVNLEHPLLVSVGQVISKQPDSARVGEWIELVYDQALLAEGSAPEDPVRFAKLVAELVTRAAEHEASAVAGPEAQVSSGPA